jgi:hypothetical protein
MKLIDKKEIDLSLKSLVKAIKMTTERVQTIAEQAIAYSIVNCDASVANKLFLAVGCNKALRKDALVKYLELNGHLAFDTKQKQFGYLINTLTGCKKGVLTAEHEATFTSKRWDEAKKEPAIVSEWDMEAQFRAFIGKMNKLASDDANTIKNSDVLDTLAITFNRWSAENTLRSMTTLEGAELNKARDDAKDAARASSQTMSDRDALVAQVKGGVALAA